MTARTASVYAPAGKTLAKIDLSSRFGGWRTDQNAEIFKTRGARCTHAVPMAGDPAYVKTIVYDYAPDALGSALARPGKSGPRAVDVVARGSTANQDSRNVTIGSTRVARCAGM